MIGWVCLQWIHLARDRNQWLAFVKAVKNLIKQTNKQTNVSIITAQRNAPLQDGNKLLILTNCGVLID